MAQGRAALTASASKSSKSARRAAARAALTQLQAMSKQRLQPDNLTDHALTLAEIRKGVAVRHSRFGTVRTLYSTNPLFTAAKAAQSNESRGRAFVGQYRALLGLDAVRDTLVYRGSSPRAGGAGSYVRFSQQRDGVPVFGASLSVLLDKQGRVNGFFSNLVPTFATSAVPKKAAASAAATALHAGDVQEGKATLFYREGADGQHRLAWQFLVKDKSQVAHRVWIDAQSGKELQRTQRIRRDLARDEISLREQGDLRRRSEPSYFCHCCADPEDESLCGLCPCLATSGSYGPALQTIWNATESCSRYWESEHGRDSWNGAGSFMNTNYEPSYGNAHFDPDDNSVTIGGAFAAGVVVGHEWGHGFANAEGVALSDAMASRAVAEGLADIFGYVIDRHTWSILQARDAANPYYGPCGGGGQATSFRRVCYDETATYSDLSQSYFNASVLSHAYYLAAVSDPDPPMSCNVDQDCRDAADDPSNTKIGCGCPDGPGTCSNAYDWVCTIKQNGVYVPFRGRNLAYFPYYYAQTSGAFSENPKLREIYDVVLTAAMDWDTANGYSQLDYLTKTTRRALLATGHWTWPQDTEGPNNVQAQRRPAVLTNALPQQACTTQLDCETQQVCEAGFCTITNWSHMYVAQPDDADRPGEIVMRKSVNNLEWSADRVLLFSGRPQQAGSGISVARDPRNGDQRVAAMVFKRRDDARIQFATASLSSSADPEWSLAQSFGETDATPAIAFFQANFMVVWKQEGGEQLYWAQSAESFQVITPIPSALSATAPTVAVANGRMWVFFTQPNANGWDGAYRIQYTSWNGSAWEPVRTLQQIEPEIEPRTSFAPEAITYGVPGSERVWLYFGRYGDARMFSFAPPQLSGSADLAQLPVTHRDAPIPLRATDLPDSAEASWLSTYQANGYLWLYHRDQSGGAWVTSKKGDG